MRWKSVASSSAINTRSRVDVQLLGSKSELFLPYLRVVFLTDYKMNALFACVLLVAIPSGAYVFRFINSLAL